MTVSGAYGRDYRTAKDMLTDWENNLDFVIRDIMNGPGRYVSYSDVRDECLKVYGRYDRDTKVVRLK